MDVVIHTLNSGSMLVKLPFSIGQDRLYCQCTVGLGEWLAFKRVKQCIFILTSCYVKI